MQTNTAFHPSKTLVYDGDYKGLPVIKNAAPFLADYLERALQTIDCAMNESYSLIWSCFELHLPNHRPAYLEHYSNNVVTKFLASLKYRAVWKQKHLANGKTVKRKANIDFVWDKNIGQNGKPYFRVILLLNREAYIDQGVPHYPADATFLYRLYNTWEKTLNITEREARNLIRFPGKKMELIRNDAEALATVFEKASTLCRAPVEDQGIGCHGFGTSRS
jgi:hypothetical protein